MSFTAAVSALAQPVLAPIFGLIDQFVEDKDERARMRHEASQAMQAYTNALMEAQSKVILAETNSQSWLPRNIRPLFLLFLLVNMTVSIVAGAFGYGDVVASGWASIPTPAWTLMQIGLGGYIAGRTVEKVVPGALSGVAASAVNVVKNAIPRWKRDEDYKK